MKKKQMTRAIAIILSTSITMTSVSWNHLLSAKASEMEESVELEPEEAKAENVIEEEKTTDTTVYDLGGNRKMEIIHRANRTRGKRRNQGWKGRAGIRKFGGV